ncbi:MAG: GNAT family N-acetyltransferase [Bacteroidota bacterium]
MIINANRLKDPKKKIYNYLVSVDKDFIPNLSSKVALHEYVEKIFKLGNVYVAVEDDTIQGLIIFYTNDKKNRKSYGALLSVRKEFEGRGLSKELFTVFIKKSKEAGMLYATCHTSNPVALKIFYSFGFFEKGREKSVIKNISDRIYLEKKL